MSQSLLAQTKNRLLEKTGVVLRLRSTDTVLVVAHAPFGPGSRDGPAHQRTVLWTVLVHLDVTAVLMQWAAHIGRHYIASLSCVASLVPAAALSCINIRPLVPPPPPLVWQYQHAVWLCRLAWGCPRPTSGE